MRKDYFKRFKHKNILNHVIYKSFHIRIIWTTQIAATLTSDYLPFSVHAQLDDINKPYLTRRRRRKNLNISIFSDIMEQPLHQTDYYMIPTLALTKLWNFDYSSRSHSD